MSQALLLKLEDEGLDTYEEALDLADWLVDTGLVHSRGEYGRFVEAVYNGGDE